MLILSQHQQNELEKVTFPLLKQWIRTHIHRPIQGFEHKKNPDGTEYTLEQQIKASRCQAIYVASYFLAQGKSYQEILNILKLFR